MIIYFIYLIIFAVLLALELLYFKIADRFNIIDKPNQRSSHTKIVLRGGGIIFLIGVWIWAAFASAGWLGVESRQVAFPWMLAGVTLAAGISFVDDIRSLPDRVRLMAHFVAMIMILFQLRAIAVGMEAYSDGNLLVAVVAGVLALVVCVGATNVYNFMDGINGITAGYSAVVLFSVLLAFYSIDASMAYAPSIAASRSLCVVMLLAVAVFAFFNFRPRGKAKCFAGDVGSVGIALILLFLIGQIIVLTGDVTYLIFLLVYGVDGCLTICHRIMLHENLGEAHRKHAYQLMANELGISHVVVSLLYMMIQLLVSLGFVLLCPILASIFCLSIIAAHWIYLAFVLLLLCSAYILFMKKYYHLHEEYLAGLG